MDEFLGINYSLVDSEYFEEYLIYIGVGYFARKVALKLKQTVCLTRNEDGSYTFKFMSPLTSSSFSFKSGEEFKEVRLDGAEMKSVITIEDNVMTHIQTDKEGRISKHVREFFADKMFTTTTVDKLDKIIKRHYIAVAQPT